MYFKTIEMTGFKSFADRTVIDLQSGMTAVVGPNGCGKSNILDAMRWALGEQSAKALRGAHMQDVIFNGSEERAATGMAEVTLTFDNADSALPIDFAEVQITRRVYRSGESEYMINKAPCRMRDIQELFMDTGIGTSAYSMIGQGKISMVLSSKPDDRRFLFEEAAGIIKYKTRKRIAIRKLDQAEQNLLRLGDIVAEVQRQMRSLKRQVNAAIRYRELSDQLKDLEVRAAWLKQQQLTLRINETREQFVKSQSEFEKESAETTKYEARFEELNLNKLEIDRVLHARREGVHEIDTEMERIERQIALLKQQVEFSEEQQKRAAQEQEEFQQLAGTTREQQEETEARTEALKATLNESTEALSAKQTEHDDAVQLVARADQDVEDARSQSVDAMNHRAKTQTAIETLTVSIENLEARLSEIYARQEEENQRREALAPMLEENQRSETEKQTRLTTLNTEHDSALANHGTLNEELSSRNEQRQALHIEKSSLEARLKSLRELRDSYEGFAAGVRSIMTAKQSERPEAQGVVGPVGDLVSTESKYERAVEAALGGAINNIVVENAEGAKSAIQYLSANRGGRVTFLPLDTIRPGRSDNPANILQRPGVIGTLLDCVTFEENLRPAMEYIFHNTLVVETIDEAIAIARAEERRPRLVTLDGEVVSSRGAVTGGRTRHEKGGLLGRSAEIDALDVQVKTKEEEIVAIAKQCNDAASAMTTLKEKIDQLVQNQNTVQAELKDLGVEMARASTELANLAQSAEAMQIERDELSERREQIDAQRHEAIEQATEIDEQDKALQTRIADTQEVASKAKHSLSQLGDALAEMRLQLAQINQSLEENERDRMRHVHEHENAVEEAQRRVQAIEDLKSNQTLLENDTKDHVERSKALSEDKEEARKKVVEAENQRQALLDESDALEKSLKESRYRSQTAQASVHKLELSLRHDEDQLNFFQERILSEYNIALGMLTEENVGTDEHDDETREGLVKEARTKLDRMGTVNLMAIEEHEALTERHDFLVSQNDDLMRARETLLNVVERIDLTIKDMFTETFNAVAENFRQYFRRLFNGGQARIYLLDEDDPLESGIEIEARPPGKKPQTISLLSGGEQAMTAIALLFSIFKAKPSPFCVLDEVDAPLDDANIGRFLDLVGEFCQETQYIVITHNKQTMAQAGALYGVTQQERGVSQIVSVRFDESPGEAEPAA